MNSLATGTQLAPCRAAITGNGKYIYAGNTASASVSLVEIDPNTGTLTLLNPVGAGGLAGLLPAESLPTDFAVLGNDILIRERRQHRPDCRVHDREGGGAGPSCS